MSRSRRDRVVVGTDVQRPFGAASAANELPDQDEIERQAFARGREQGFEEGVQQVSQDFEARAESLRRELNETLRQLTILEEERLRETAQLIGELALVAAEKIVREKIAADDPIAVRAIEGSVAMLPDNIAVRARLNPDDLELVSQELADQVEAGRLELIADELISRGGCRVESDAGTIDATLEIALSDAAAVMADSGELT